MKNYKWLWVTLTILFTLVILAGVALVSFRLGAMHAPALNRNTAAGVPYFGPMQGNGDNFNRQFKGSGQMMQGFGHFRMGERGFEHGRGGFIFRPLLGLLELAVLALLIGLRIPFTREVAGIS